MGGSQLPTTPPKLPCIPYDQFSYYPKLTWLIAVFEPVSIASSLGLRCKQKRKFKATTDSKHTLPLAPNLLDRQFSVVAPDQAMVTDITYIATDEGWLYLAGVKDLLRQSSLPA